MDLESLRDRFVRHAEVYGWVHIKWCNFFPNPETVCPSGCEDIFPSFYCENHEECEDQYGHNYFEQDVDDNVDDVDGEDQTEEILQEEEHTSQNEFRSINKKLNRLSLHELDPSVDKQRIVDSNSVHEFVNHDAIPISDDEFQPVNKPRKAPGNHCNVQIFKLQQL